MEEVEEKIHLDTNLFFRNKEFNSSEEVETFIADQLKKNGYVKDGYKEALLDREKEYPTGLPSDEPRVAIPHANADLVNKTTIVVITLKDPVIFKNMGDVTEDLKIKIVIGLVIAEPHSQVKVLQRIMGIVEDEDLRQKIVNADSNEKLMNLMKKVLN